TDLFAMRQEQRAACSIDMLEKFSISLCYIEIINSNQRGKQLNVNTVMNTVYERNRQQVIANFA
ncbi:hypothetical protein OAI26_09705, partial [Sulfitobacter sp.]|nr:hypothetical protein [Sulfitobacter sp.]